MYVAHCDPLTPISVSGSMANAVPQAIGVQASHPATTATAFTSLGVQAVTLGLAAGTGIFARALNELWIAAPIFVVLAAVMGAVYFLVLSKVDGIAAKQRETLIQELSRA